MKDKYFWLATRNGEPCGCFETRRDAIKWLKAMLKQAQKDYNTQDKTDEYDYPINIGKIDIKQYQQRKTFLPL